MVLHDILAAPVAARPGHPAVVEGEGQAALSYRELDALSNRLRDRLAAIGVRPGDRVGIYLPKTADTVAVIFGILKAGAAYVPVDPTAPAGRNAYIHHNCQAAVVVVDRALEPAYRAELTALGATPTGIVLDQPGGGAALRRTLDALDATAPAAVTETAIRTGDDLAYILYTSGSTGTPKGVMLTHRNAVAFVDWCSRVFEPTGADVFSSHAPFHFDLSILDIYVPLKHGATLVLVPEKVGKEPKGLADLIARNRITFWYSAPSTLALLAQSGRLTVLDFSSLKLVLFAGEVFPVVHLRSLTQQWPWPRYFNLYGPTETNVCTYSKCHSRCPRAGPSRTRLALSASTSRHASSTRMAGMSPPASRGNSSLRGRTSCPGTGPGPTSPRRRFYPTTAAAGGIERGTLSSRMPRRDTAMSADVTGWSRSVATASSSARSRRACIAIPTCARRPWLRCPTTKPGSTCGPIFRYTRDGRRRSSR